MANDLGSILWVEDNPDFLKFWSIMHPDLNVKELVKNVTWAHSKKEAEEKYASSNFDLCILDGDFPPDMSPERLDYINNYLIRLKKGQPVEYFKFDSGETRGSPWSNFIPLYKNTMYPKGQKTIVFSLSQIALPQAYTMGLPYYSKWSDDSSQVREELRRLIDNSLISFQHVDFGADPRSEAAGNVIKKLMSKESIECYEIGCDRELIERYLLPSFKS
jgi:hypothetical protein